jgi:3-oxoacyl-[acyl-carrier protein] reductase
MAKIFIITGTRKGLGKELCQYYLSQGNKVFGCSRGPSSIDDPAYFHYELDVSDESKVVKMVKDVSKKHGQIDVLINNAGIASMNHILLTPLKTVQEIFSTNYFGTFLFCREVAKVMTRKKHGRIVNFTTVATPMRLEGEIAYASSKAAIENFTEIISRELAEFNITVNAVGPTPIPTDLIKNVPMEKMDSLIQRQAIHRFGNFDDLANVIDFFIDDRSNFVTGQVIYLGGVNR